VCGYGDRSTGFQFLSPHVSVDRGVSLLIERIKYAAIRLKDGTIIGLTHYAACVEAGTPDEFEDAF
jgi:hypothetical protein